MSMGSDTDGDVGVELVRRSFDTFNTGDIEACVGLLAEDFVAHVAGSPAPQHGREPWRQNALMFREAFPDLVATIDDIFGRDDRVAVRLTFRGTHDGPFFGMAATGRRVSFTSLELYRVAGGRLAEEWVSPDVTTLLAQVAPTPEPT